MVEKFLSISIMNFFWMYGRYYFVVLQELIWIYWRLKYQITRYRWNLNPEHRPTFGWKFHIIRTILGLSCNFAKSYLPNEMIFGNKEFRIRVYTIESKSLLHILVNISTNGTPVLITHMFQQNHCLTKCIVLFP